VRLCLSVIQLTAVTNALRYGQQVFVSSSLADRLKCSRSPVQRVMKMISYASHEIYLILLMT